MNSPNYQAPIQPSAPAPDPSITQQVQQQQVAAQTSNNVATQHTAALDTADLMARYGTMLALGGTISPQAVATPAATPAATTTPYQNPYPYLMPSAGDAGGLGGLY